MKIILILFLSLAYYALTNSQPTLPPEVMVGKELLPAKDFILWKEKNCVKYNGIYFGEVGPDTEDSLTINYQEKTISSTRKATAFLVSGIYKRQNPYLPDTILLFRNAFSPADGVAEIGPLSITFVTLKNRKGVIVGGFFLPKSLNNNLQYSSSYGKHKTDSDLWTLGHSSHPSY